MAGSARRCQDRNCGVVEEASVAKIVGKLAAKFHASEDRVLEYSGGYVKRHIRLIE